MDLCEIVLVTSESLDYEFSEANCIELLKFWCEVLTIRFGMYAYVWWCINEPNIGEKHFFRSNWKNCSNNGKKCTACVHPLIKCSSMFSFKNAILRECGGKTAGFSFMQLLLMKCFRNALTPRKLPYPVKFLVAHLRVGFTPDKRTDFFLSHAYIVPDRFL